MSKSTTNRSADVMVSVTGEQYALGRRLAAASTVREEEGSTAPAELEMRDIWSLIQARCMQMLSYRKEGRSHLLNEPVTRTQRTAGNYAKMYLADQGTPYEDRFYWVALAAFAAKGVVMGVTRALEALPSMQVKADPAAVSLYYLLKGNMWLFLEVTPWHYYWQTQGLTRPGSGQIEASGRLAQAAEPGPSTYVEDFSQRDESTYDPVMKEAMERLPWAKGKNAPLIRALEKAFGMHWEFPGYSSSDPVTVGPLGATVGVRSLPASSRIHDDDGALKELEGFKVQEALLEGFKAIKEYEDAVSREEKITAITKSATFLIKHEQEFCLQRMIYDHSEFVNALRWNDIGRWTDENVFHIPFMHFIGVVDPEVLFNASLTWTPELKEKVEREYDLRREDILVTMELKDGDLWDMDDRREYTKKLLNQFTYLMYKNKDGSTKYKYRAYMIEQLRVIEQWHDIGMAG